MSHIILCFLCTTKNDTYYNAVGGSFCFSVIVFVQDILCKTRITMSHFYVVLTVLPAAHHPGMAVTDARVSLRSIVSEAPIVVAF